MHTFESLLQDVKQAGINQKGTLLIHSSMKAVGDVEGKADTVLDVFIEYMKDGLLVFPTHAWSGDNLKDGIYDPKTEPACVGILPNLFMKKEGAIRSMHPTHSVTAIGERAEQFTSLDVEAYTPCPRHGCFASLYDEHAQLLFLGAPLSKNTFIHSLEEWLNIPDRINPQTRTIKVKHADNQLEEITFQSHHSSLGDVSLNYIKLLEPMLEKGIAKEVKIGDATSYIVDVKRMTDWVYPLLKENPALFNDLEPMK